MVSATPLPPFPAHLRADSRGALLAGAEMTITSPSGNSMIVQMLGGYDEYEQVYFDETGDYYISVSEGMYPSAGRGLSLETLSEGFT